MDKFDYDKVEPFPGSATIFISTFGYTGGYSCSSRFTGLVFGNPERI